MNTDIWRCFRIGMLVIVLATLALPAAPIHAQSANLLTNGDFAQGGAGWDTCANAAIVDANAPGVNERMVFSGRYAARISYDADDQTNCGDDSFYDPRGQISQSFTVPNDADVLTVEFRYSRVGQVQKPLRVTVGTESGLFGRSAETDQVDPGELGGWSIYRSEFSASETSKLRGQTLNLYLSISAWSIFESSPHDDDADQPGYYIDDVKMIAGRAYTAEAPLPAALASDGTRPLLYNSLLGITRANTDGSGAQSISSDETQGTTYPTWSPDGKRIGLLKTSITQEDPGNLRINQAFITIVLTTDANGGNAREIYRTAGLPGYHSIPYDPVNPEKPALDVEIKALTWSPNSSALALSVCATQRYSNGHVNDSYCYDEIRDLATGNLVYKTERLNRLHWGSNNRIIAEGTDPYGTRDFGIWQIDMNTNPPTETLLVPGAPLVALREDRFPTWSPDGTQFVTARRVAGYSYYSDDDSRNYHQAIVVFAAGNPVGRTLIVADQGNTPANFTWSPDGKFILYSLNQGDTFDIWWLDVATGATGKVTHDGNSIAANWRPSCSGAACDAGGTTNLFIPVIVR